MVHVRKTQAGTDSAGHVWPTDGAVIEVPAEHALVLTRIPDGGFDIVEAEAATGVAEEHEDKRGEAASRMPQKRAVGRVSE